VEIEPFTLNESVAVPRNRAALSSQDRQRRQDADRCRLPCGEDAVRQTGQGQRPHHAPLQRQDTLTGIPLEAYYYIVNGKPALDWVVERQCVKTDKDSGIVNDANDWAVDTMKNPRYPLELFQRVITVSLETMKIVRSLPGLAI
jgi:hypothetical protein